MTKTAIFLSALFMAMVFACHQTNAANLSEEIEDLRKQIQALQVQIEALAKQKVPSPPRGAYEKAEETEKTGEKQSEVMPGVKIKLGGYIETTGIWRSKNQTQDTSTTWNGNSSNTTGIPFANNVNAHQSEFRGSVRASRLSLSTEGVVDNNLKLSAYLESDFLGAARTANSVQTNGYTPRLRHAFAEVNHSGLGIKFVSGQTWSLAVLNKESINTLGTLTTAAIDTGYLPGTVALRTPQIRAVKSFEKENISIGISAESPQVNFGQVSVPSTVTAATFGHVASFNPNVQYSTDLAPDIIGKAAYDSGIGHYELFGIMRFFRDKLNADFRDNTVIAGGGGIGAYWQLLSKKIEVHTSFVGGEGIGRYSSGRFPDFSFAPNGAIKPITRYSGTIGIIGHPSKSWDVYLYAGYDAVFRNNEENTMYGYGNYSLDNSGCYAANESCPAQTSSMWQISPGFWKQFYKGDCGTMRVGASYSLTRRNAFSDANGNAPHAYQNVIMTALRYAPF